MAQKRDISTAKFSPINNGNAKRRFIEEVNELACSHDMQQHLESAPPQIKAMLEKMNGLLKVAAELIGNGDSMEEAIEEDRRQHTVVVFGLNESKKEKQTLRAKEDKKTVHELLEEAGIEDTPVSITRMGPPDEKKTRAIKVVMSSKKAAQALTKKKKKIQATEKFKKVTVQECMTKEQQERRKELVERCKKMRELSGWDLVIFANHIVSRQLIKDSKEKILNPSYISWFDPNYRFDSSNREIPSAVYYALRNIK
jgi:hypothetical protein